MYDPLIAMGAVMPVAAAGTSVLTDNIKTSIQNGIANLQATVSDAIAITIGATVGVIALTAGVSYALKKIKGVVKSAS